VSKLARISIGIVVTLALLGGLAWANRVELMLSAIGFAIERRYPTRPNVPVHWESGPDPAGRAPQERPPNVVLILADDLGWNDLTFGGGGVAGGTVPTPHMDSIAAEGVNFTQGYAANATCAPSRAALMTGRYGTRFGFEFTPTPPGMMQLVGMMSEDAGPRMRPPIYGPGGFSAGYDRMGMPPGMPPSEITLAELLAEQGYHTVHIGKWHLGRTGGKAPEDQGFDESLLMTSGLYLPEDSPDVVNAKQDFDPIDRFLWAALNFTSSYNGGDSFEPARYLTDYYTDEAVKVIEANRDRPFFLFLAHWAPHTPLQAAREDYEALSHIELHRERVYAAMIRSLDRGVGRVLDALREQGLEENTLVVFTSDNGGAHYIGLPDVNQPYRGWKATFFEGGIRVPYFAKWPARIAPGTTVDDPVHHFDIFATAAAAAGAPLPDDRMVDGVDLLPFVRGEATGVPHRELFWRSGASRAALVDGWKLSVSDPPGRRWLFDLRADPTEQRDVSAEHPEKVAALKRALAAHDAEQEPSSWLPSISRAITIDKDLTVPEAADDEYIYWSN
jgi:uncharacterized sulfatase